MARPSGRPLREEILAAARPRIQSVGVDGFSFTDIAKQLDVKAPSIHHHFPSKADLVREVAQRYRADFASRVSAIDADRAVDRLLAYADLFDEPAANGLLCLCGALAAEWPSVSPEVRAEVEGFFTDQRAWLTAQLRAGVSSGEFDGRLDAAEVGHALLGALEGSLLLARATNTAGLARTTVRTLVSLL